jgi:hypothetical protein
MMKNVWLSAGLILALSGCNLYSGLSSPSNDEQYLISARGCMDRGDFQCALDNYKALSGSGTYDGSSLNDIKVNETSLATLAKANIFLMGDLIGSLGSGRGSGASFATMANTLAARGAGTAANRVIIQQTFADNGSITNTKLKAFSKFLSALSMANAILAETAGSDGILTAGDIVANPTACKVAGTCSGNPDCAQPGTSNVALSDGHDPVAYNSTTDTGGLYASTNWGGNATLKKFISAAENANTEAGRFTGASGGSGIFSAINTLAGLGSSLEPCVRQQLVNTLGL